MDYTFASQPELPSLHEHPLYAEGMAHIANGQWQSAFQSFRLLQGIYPEDAEVAQLLDQTQMRATMARFEPRPSSRTPKRLSGRRLVLGVVVAMLIAIAGYVAYELWINPVLIQELALREITRLRNEADQAIEAGDYARARQSLQRLQTIRPEDTQTAQALQRIEQVERLSDLYDQAKALMTAGSWAEAIQVLTELQSLDAEYRDLPELLQVARESQSLERQFQAAEATFARADWAGAITQYQALRQANLTFRFEEIQARLHESYLRYGQARLVEAGSDPSRVSEAASLFAEALKIKPMDDEALKQRRLAETYLAALNSKDQDEVIDLLQMVYNQDPDYAGKQAAQLLYAALLNRADTFLKSGDKTAAIAAYQVAAQLEVDDPSQAQEKLAELTSETAP
jgi:outer membrane protein assembly factor BamD (BamD/ComL family)